MARFGRNGLLVAILLVMTGSACRARFANLSPRLPERYVETGPASGSACGDLLGFIPIMVNSRTLRAYNAAVERAGATALTNTTVTDSWFWTPIGLFLCTKVDGTGIREQPTH
jgi:hypothetical protein